MTLMSALHNLSRSIGAVLFIVFGGKTLTLVVLGVEMILYLLFIISRRDFHVAYSTLEGPVGIAGSLTARVASKLIADFSGCLHLRHPQEMGGMVFTVGVIWSQLFPFVALTLFDEHHDLYNLNFQKQHITLFLASIAGLWAILTVVFLCSIDLKVRRTNERSKLRARKKTNKKKRAKLMSEVNE